MSILIDRNTRVICQGITGKTGTTQTEKALKYGTNIVGGVTPGKGGQTHLGVPVFDSVKEAIASTGATASVIYTPIVATKDAIIEAIDAGIKLIVCITEGIPTIDMLMIKEKLISSDTRLIGPNTPGIITPNQSALGIMPVSIFKPGNIGVISRSGTLMYEAVQQLSENGLGQSTCLGVGGDMVRGLDFKDCLLLFEQDKATEAILLIGEIGGSGEVDAANLITDGKISKPVFAYIAGMSVPKLKRMGHAGAIIANESETAQEKVKILSNAGVKIIDSVELIGQTVERALNVKTDKVSSN